MTSSKIGTIFFLGIFGIILCWLVIIPSIKMSGYVPSLNMKITKVLEKEQVEKIEITYLGLRSHKKDNYHLPMYLDNSIIDVLSEIMNHPIVKDGYKRGTETETIEMAFYIKKTVLLTCKCSWDSARQLMEVRFDDTKKNQKNKFYSISPNLADRLFGYIKQN